MVVVWGERIGLRPFEDPLTDGEAARVYRWSRDEQLAHWSGGTPTELTLEEFRGRLRGDRNHGLSDRRAFFIVTRAGELIGRVGCFAIDWDGRQGELGIVIGERAYWGQGYGRDAVTTLLRHIFETTPLESIHLFTYPENLRAQRCFAACGFRVVGIARRFSPEVGEHDSTEMKITHRELQEHSLRKARVHALIPIPQEQT